MVITQGWRSYKYNCYTYSYKSNALLSTCLHHGELPFSLQIEASTFRLRPETAWDTPCKPPAPAPTCGERQVYHFFHRRRDERPTQMACMMLFPYCTTSEPWFWAPLAKRTWESRPLGTLLVSGNFLPFPLLRLAPIKIGQADHSPKSLVESIESNSRTLTFSSLTCAMICWTRTLKAPPA